MYRGGKTVETPSESLSADIGKDWGALTSLHIWMWTSSITPAFGIVHFLRFLTIVSPLACVNTWVWRTQKCSLKPKEKATSAYLSGNINCLTWESRLFWKKMPSSISGTPLNAQELSGTLRNALDLFRCCQHDASSLGRIEALQHYKNFGLLSQS